jgi:hypothetical protein
VNASDENDDDQPKNPNPGLVNFILKQGTSKIFKALIDFRNRLHLKRMVDEIETVSRNSELTSH